MNSFWHLSCFRRMKTTQETSQEIGYLEIGQRKLPGRVIAKSAQNADWVPANAQRVVEFIPIHVAEDKVVASGIATERNREYVISYNGVVMNFEHSKSRTQPTND